MAKRFPPSVRFVDGVSIFSGDAGTGNDSGAAFAGIGSVTGKDNADFVGKLFMGTPLFCSANSDKLFFDVLTKSALPKIAAAVINPASIPALRDVELKPVDMATPSEIGRWSPTLTPMMIAAR